MKRSLTLTLVLMMLTAFGGANALAAKKDKNDKKTDTKAAAPDTRAGKADKRKEMPAGKVDLNSASQADLEKIPGVGAATAKKIIAGRPYTAVGDLSKAGVSASTIGKITPMVEVRPAAAAAAAGAGSAPAAPTRASRAHNSPVANTPAASAPSAPAGNPPPVRGMVWVNKETKVFHRAGDRWYGNTKNGTYMTEEDAVKQGYRAAKK